MLLQSLVTAQVTRSSGFVFGDLCVQRALYPAQVCIVSCRQCHASTLLVIVTCVRQCRASTLLVIVTCG